MSEAENQTFEQKVRNRLRASEQQLSNEEATALSMRRNQALAAPAKRKLPTFFAPAMGMAAASVVALVLINPFATIEPPVEPATGEYLSGYNGDELYEELDFYSWLAATESSLEG